MNNRRKRYLIDRRIQLKYAILTISLLVLYTMVLLIAIFAPHIMALFLDIPLSQKAEAAEALLLLHKNIWPGIGFIILLFGILSIYMTHKIAGPVFVFERMARDIAGGNLTIRAKLRKGDDLHDLAEDLNRMADNLESLLVNLDEEYKKLTSYISELRRELEAKHISEQTITELAKKIENDKDVIGRILEQYKYRERSVNI